jgi:hypothetical protein
MKVLKPRIYHHLYYIMNIFFIYILKRNERFQNITYFPFDVGNKQSQFKNRLKIIINQIDLG